MSIHTNAPHPCGDDDCQLCRDHAAAADLTPKHTPEPWDDFGGIILYESENGNDFTVKVYDNSANRARIVACVNALAGIPDPAAFVKSHAELVVLCKAFVEQFESGWPSHATGSIGGMGHAPDAGCAACRMMKTYESAITALDNAKKVKDPH